MPAATIRGGALKPIDGCYVVIPIEGESEDFKLEFKVLPDISDSKSVSYNDEAVIGRASPLKTYSQSDNRTISMQIHMVVSSESDVEYNITALRAIQSAAYPRNGKDTGAPFVPPPVCRMKCGMLLSSGQDLCVVLKSYSVKFPTEVAWDESTFVPFKFDIDTSWDVVYKSAELPGQDRIFQTGR